jgi:hypothetical protein
LVGLVFLIGTGFLIVVARYVGRLPPGASQKGNKADCDPQKIQNDIGLVIGQAG